VFPVPINYAARRAASHEVRTNLKHGVYFFHHHQMRFFVQAAAR